MKILRSLAFLSFILAAFSVWADDVEVVVEPKEPVINESFFVTFKIKATGSEEPYISFTPYGASVLGKSSQGLSISTVVINGKFTTTKEQSVVYELMAERAGQVYLRNVKVEINGKTIPVKEVRVNVLTEAKKIPDAFIEVETSKTKVYLGEGMDVRYYLYFRSSIAANDVAEFPKLNKFIKRFHKTLNNSVETVQYKGQLLRRVLAYSARVYPEKTGTLVLDPMKLSVQIVENDYSGFGGFGSQRYRNKELASPRMEIEVLPLPAEGVPPGFTGLIGEHEFVLTAPKSKYLVNEPIELKLQVTGKGALENMESPIIYSDNNLEQFDTKSEVTELGAQEAKKVFEYTLLARGKMNIPARELPLAYFDPGTGKYVEKKIPVPALEVSGEAMAKSTTSGGHDEVAGKNSGDNASFLNSFLGSKAPSPEKNAQGLVGPTLIGQGRWFDKNIMVLNVLLGLSLVAFIGNWAAAGRLQLKSPGHHALIKRDIRLMKKRGLSYSELYRVLSYLDKTNKMAGGGVSLAEIVNESPLSKEAMEYFKNAITKVESGTYAKNHKGNVKDVNFEKKYFKELMKII